MFLKYAINKRNILLCFIVSICIMQLRVSRSVINEEKAGVKLAIKQDFLDNMKHDFLPGIIKILGNYTLPDQEISLDLKLAKMKIDINNTLISLNISNITEDNFELSFLEPNKINLEIKNISGNVSFDDSFTLSIFKESSHVSADVLNFDLKMQLELTEVESKQIKGKMLPSLTLQNVDLNLDFTYEISGDFWVNITNNKFIKSLIVKLIKSQLTKMLINTLKGTVNNYISDTIASLPLYIPLDNVFNKTGLALDYEILSKPKITEGNFLSVNTKGLIVNTNINQTLNPPYELPSDIPDSEEHKKVTELFLSDFSLNGALYTLFLSEMLKFNLDSSLLPKDFPIKLNTTSLDIIFNGLSNVFGIDIPTEISLYALSAPNLNFTEENIDLKLSFGCDINVLVNETNKVLAYKLNSSFRANVNLTVEENGSVKANINNLYLQDSQMIETVVPETSINNIENLFNFAASVGAPIINKKYLNNIVIPLPTIYGIKISNSTVYVKDKYVDIHVNPDYSDVLEEFNEGLKFLN